MMNMVQGCMNIKKKNKATLSMFIFPNLQIVSIT